MLGSGCQRKKKRPNEAALVREARLAFEYSLSNFMWKQAVFFAERLVAECPCEEMTYLLALAYFHNQETGRAHWHLQGNRLPEARYLLAKCCFILQRWEEAEDALLPAGPHGCGGGSWEVVNGAAGLYLLGQVKERQSKREQAVECYAKCLELCPFMWDAYERWSWLILGSPSPSRSSTASMAPSAFSDEKFAHAFAGLQAPGGPTAAASRPVPESRGGPAGASGRRSDRELPHHVTTRKDRRDPQRLGAGNFPQHQPGHGAATSSGKEPASARRQAPAPESAPPGGGEAGGEVSLASLLCKLGMALHAMHSFESHQTIQLLSTLPRRHHETGYVMNLVGLCHFESADYRKAEQAFQQVWRIEPRRVEGLEYYSSALWHLRKDIELGHLAQQCLQWDRLKPQVWCVVGNCFSLQREHDVAIKFFKRAIQVDPSCTYAYTLCGHEFVANEKFDKAVPMYEHALSVDPRHYNAWWGLGNIYHRQEEHENARYHFLKALEINKSNSVLRCYLGMVLDSLNNPLMALENFDRASQGEPQNGMAYYQKACVLMSLERFEEALADLKKVCRLAPKEACVHFQLGKVYMKLRRDKKALLHFNIAMDLNRDSKDYHTIKTHIERLHIRGIKEPEVDSAAGGNKHGQGRLHSSSSSNAGDDHDRADTRGPERNDHTNLLAVHGGSPQAAGQRHGGSAAYPSHHHGGAAAAGSPFGRSAAPDAAGAAGPQTPGTARGSARGQPARGSPQGTWHRHGAAAYAAHHGGPPASARASELGPGAAGAGAAAGGPQTPALARGGAHTFGAPVGGRSLWSSAGRGTSAAATGAAVHGTGFRI